jgi:hypothetical protein
MGRKSAAAFCKSYKIRQAYFCRIGTSKNLVIFASSSIVVPEHPSVVGAADRGIDVGEAVLDDFAILVVSSTTF